MGVRPNAPVAKAVITTPRVGSAELEVYGIMGDGTVVLGCTELDGTARPTTSLDAHAHVCAKDGGRGYTPEIQYSSTSAK